MAEQPSIYSALPTPENGSPNIIRLLRILPGKEPETIRCELQVVHLSDAPRFEALSYVWGDPNPPDHIECNGQRKSVTPNLGAALRRLRREDAERLVWIDAICVNQEDLAERSKQVLLMQDIYSQAWRVVVWLGEDDGQAEEAIKIIEKAAAYWVSEVGKSLDEIDFDSFSALEGEEALSVAKQDADNQRDFPPLDHMDDPSNPWDAVAWFYAHPWFSRIWIIQEVAFAPALMYIGSREVRWNCVGVAAKWLYLKSYGRSVEEMDNYKQAAAIILVRCLVGSPFPFFLGHLDSKATDPRDKIFALLGLSDEDSRANTLIQPDYKKDIVEVYIDATRYIIAENLEGHGLGDIFGIAPEPFVEVEDRFPSWVPRWDISVMKNRERLIDSGEGSPWRAGGDSRQDISQTTDTRILTLKGVRFGKVNSVNRVLQHIDDMDRVKHLWDEVSQELVHYRGPDSLKQAFAQTITAGCVLEIDGERRLLGSADLHNYLSCRDGQVVFPLHPFGGADDPVTRAFDFLGCVQRKTFFTTEKGHIGLGCNIIKPGDIVCVFYGHNLPYVLRPVGNRYMFMGQCYAHGFMYGKAVDEMNAGKLMEEWFDLC